jgi:hypothetical protein
MISVGNYSAGQAALIIAHPGHELCVYGWLETTRPLVFVLTDGAGRSGVSRLNSTTKILSGTGAAPGSIYGRFTDLEIYKAILNRDLHLFEELVSELAQALVTRGIEEVSGEAIEGYNPVHDTWRLVVDAAVQLAGRSGNRPIINREFLLFARHQVDLEPPRAGDLTLLLDDEQLERKLAAAVAYPELQSEVDAMLNKRVLERLREFPDLSAYFSDVVTRTMGKEAYRVECQRLSGGLGRLNGATDEVPFYERYGEKLVAAGVYDRAITYREHIMPLAESVSSFVDDRFAKDD